METVEQALDRYREFIRRVDALLGGIVRRHRERIVCGPGCDGCCTSFSVLPVEAAVLREGVSALGSIPSGSDGRCSLLASDRLCAVYEKRPLICRTHGLPITGGEIGEARDCCPLCFRDLPLERLSGGDVLDLDSLNRLLIAINALYLKAAGYDPLSTGRVEIARLVLPRVDNPL